MEIFGAVNPTDADSEQQHHSHRRCPTVGWRRLTLKEIAVAADPWGRLRAAFGCSCFAEFRASCLRVLGVGKKTLGGVYLE